MRNVQSLNEYQDEAGKFERTPALCAVLGLVGEAGEVADEIALMRRAASVADHLKKVEFHGKPLDSVKLEKELGDCFWYLARVAAHYGLTLAQVANTNLEKLDARFPKGYFTQEDSNARVDEAFNPALRSDGGEYTATGAPIYSSDGD